MIYNIFFDIDGTLLPFDVKVWPDSIYEGLKKLKEEGHNLYIATGRHFLNIPPYIKDSGLFDAYVCLNGGVCYIDGNPVHMEAFPEQTLEQIDALHKKCDVPILWTTLENGILFNASVENFEIKKRVENDFKIFTQNEIPHAVFQVSVYADEKVDEIFAKGLPLLHIARWNDVFFDINNRHVSKASGIEKLREIFGFTRDSIICVGDAENDIEMVKYAKIGISVEDGYPELIQVADKIIPSAKEGGVIKILDIINS